MKQLYVIGAILILVLLTIILGYKVVEYRKDISDLTLANETLTKERDNLKKDKTELSIKYQELNDAKQKVKPKVIKVKEIVEVEVGNCDNDPIGSQYINGLRELLSSN